MTTPLVQLIATLRELEKNATPRPWVHEMIPSDAGGSYTTGHVISVHHTYRGNTVVRPDSVTGPDSMTHADGELITEMRNALPELLDVGDQRFRDGMEAVLDALKAIGIDVGALIHADLQKFIEQGMREFKSRKRHALNCPAYGNYQPPYEDCNCGFE